jgi:hypothetical protein
MSTGIRSSTFLFAIPAFVALVAPHASGGHVRDGIHAFSLFPDAIPFVGFVAFLYLAARRAGSSASPADAYRVIFSSVFATGVIAALLFGVAISILYSGFFEIPGFLAKTVAFSVASLVLLALLIAWGFASLGARAERTAPH